MASKHDSTDQEELRRLESSLAPASSQGKENNEGKRQHLDDGETEQRRPKKLKAEEEFNSSTEFSKIFNFGFVDGRTFPRGHGRDLGQELLLRPTLVQQLDLDLANFLGNTTDEAEAEEEMKYLLSFFAASKSLVQFGVQGSTGREISSILLDGISKCQKLCRLKWHLPVPPTEFCTFMTTRSSLKELDIVFDFRSRPREKYSDDERDLIAAAFRSSKKLQKLALSVKGDEATFAAILKELQEHPTLRDLQCGPFGDSDTKSADEAEEGAEEGADEAEDGANEAEKRADTISTYLQSVTKLDRLTMSLFDYDGKDMVRLLPGLEHAFRAAGDPPTTHPRSLCIYLPSTGDIALEHLFEFLETATDGKVVYQSSLRELCLVGDCRLGLDSSNRLASSLMETAKATTDGPGDQGAVDNSGRGPPELMPTIGCQIHTLCLDLDVDESFLSNLANNADRVRLHTLELRKDFHYRDSDVALLGSMADNVATGTGGGTNAAATPAYLRGASSSLLDHVRRDAPPGATMLNRGFFSLSFRIGDGGNESTEGSNDAAQSMA